MGGNWKKVGNNTYYLVKLGFADGLLFTGSEAFEAKKRFSKYRRQGLV